MSLAKKLAVLAAVFAIPLGAHAQTAWTFGYKSALNSAALNSAGAGKQDYLGTVGSGHIVLDTSPTIHSPTFVTPALGAASGTSLALGGCLPGTNSLCTSAGTSLGGSIYFAADNTYSIGASGANRPQNVYLGGSLLFGSGSFLRDTGTGVFSFSNASGTNSFTITTQSGGGANFSGLGVVPQTITKYIGPTGDYHTLNDAINWSNQQVFQVGSTVTFLLQDGQTNEPGYVLLMSSFGKQIFIQSQHSYNFSLSSIQSSSGSAGAWTYVLNLTATTNIAVGDYLTIPAPSGGTNPTYIAGVWPVTAVDTVNNRVTITTTGHQSGVASGAVTGTVTDNKGTLKFSNSDGLEVWNGQTSINLSNLNIVGDGSAHNGISEQDGDRVYTSGTVSVYGFGLENILLLYNSEFNSTGPVVLSNAGGPGMWGESSSTFDAPTLVSTGNGGDGATFTGSGASMSTGNSSIYSGNGGNGLQVTWGGSAINAGTIAVTGNTLAGVTTGNQGVIQNGTLTSANNGSADQLNYNAPFGLNVQNGLSVNYGTLQTNSTYPFIVNGGGQFNGQYLNLHYSGVTQALIDGGSGAAVVFRDAGSVNKWEVGHRGSSNSYAFHLYNDNLSKDAMNVSLADDSVAFDGGVKHGSVAVGGTNSCAVAGQTVWVTDSTVAFSTSTRGGQITGGGANAVPAYCDGAHWDYL